MDRKYMPIKQFQDDGYLQEINRRLLHPCGLALEVKITDGEVSALRILDARDDPEGIIFAESDPPDWKKRNRVNEALNAHLAGRCRQGLGLNDPYLGGSIQPCPEPGE
jgi:hypothetical protein